jgi:ABC-type Fe2+-enterobactin transport system substrate-binding protein
VHFRSKPQENLDVDQTVAGRDHWSATNKVYVLNWAPEVSQCDGGKFNMSVKLLNTAIVTGLLLAIAAPAFAAEPAAPTTKADCEKMKDMKWDDATKACVKK